MSETAKYRFRVKYPGQEEVEVIAADRYGAVIGAAKAWGLRWTTIAKDCEVHQLGRAKVKKNRR